MYYGIVMTDSYNKLAQLLHTTPERLLALEQEMALATGKEGILEEISKENDILVERTLTELGISKDTSAQNVSTALADRLAHLDRHLFELLGKPDPSKMEEMCGTLCQTALKVFTPPPGLFIKKDRVVGLLEKYNPDALLEHFGYSSVAELVEKEGFAPVVASLRFVQSREWMDMFFKEAYSSLTPEDFEERTIEMHVLSAKWLAVAEKFLERKYHNVSHLKEFGIIFIIPIIAGTPGETIRMFTLLLHYLHEVPFYTGLFRRYLHDADFAEKFASLLRGDVPAGLFPQSPGHVVWPIIQRYLAKDDPSDPRLAEPHINPEAEHWYKAEKGLGGLTHILERDKNGANLGFWTGLDFVAGFFKDADGKDKAISFNLMDTVLSLVANHNGQYHYHQPEALWNKIFMEYTGRDKMNELMEKNLIAGFVQL